MKTPEEILRALEMCTKPGKPGNCIGCPYIEINACRREIMVDARRIILSLLPKKTKEPTEEHKPIKYWDNISAINARQEAKGQAKYGEQLEDNVTLTTAQRIEHAQEEAIDLLKYLEHLKQIANDGITANDYQRAALRTASGMNDQAMGEWAKVLVESGVFTREKLMLLNGVLGLDGESGEVSDLVKKHLFQGHDLDKTKIAEELGDVAWYLAVTAHAIGYTLGDIFQGNVDKLKKRYPDGFDKNRSIHREEGDKE